MGGISLRTLGAASLVAAVASTFGRVIGFVKEVIVAGFYGRSDAIDIYLYGFVLIGLPLAVIMNAVQTALIARCAEARDDPARVFQLLRFAARKTLGWLALLLPCWLALLALGLPWFAAGFDADKRADLQLALLWLAPYYFLNAFNLLAYGALQGQGRFWANGLVPLITPMLTMAGLLLVQDLRGDWRLLVVTLAIGFLIEAVILFALLYRPRDARARSDHLGVATTKLIEQSKGLLPGTAAMAVATIVDQVIAAALPAGSVAALAYGFRIPTAIQQILVLTVSITVLPYFVRLLSEDKIAYSLHSLRVAKNLLLLGGILVAVVLVYLSDPLLRVVFERGAFGDQDVKAVVPIQQWYLAQLPGALVAMLALRCLAAMGAVKTTSAIVIGVAISQSILGVILSRLYGVTGIAMAGAIVGLLSAACAYHFARTHLERMHAIRMHATRMHATQR